MTKNIFPWVNGAIHNRLFLFSLQNAYTEKKSNNNNNNNNKQQKLLIIVMTETTSGIQIMDPQLKTHG